MNSPKKMLAILGSPHMDGSCAHMLDCAIRAARDAGWTVERIHLYQQSVAYCSGCRACLQTGCCVQKDDLQAIAGLLKDCDFIALAAPVYWANVPAAVKNLFDRLLGTVMEETGAFPKPRLSGRQKYLFLTACNTPFPFSRICGQSGGAIRAVDEFFKTAGVRCAGRVVFTNTGRKKELPASLKRKIVRCWKKGV